MSNCIKFISGERRCFSFVHLPQITCLDLSFLIWIKLLPSETIRKNSVSAFLPTFNLAKEIQDKQELKVSHCFWMSSFLHPCHCTASGCYCRKEIQKWSNTEMAKDSWAGLARGWSYWPRSSKGSELSFQHAHKCVGGLEPKCLGPTGWSCKIHRFIDSRARGELCDHLFQPVMCLTEAKWRHPIPSLVLNWQWVTPGKYSSIYHRC